jgi:hypothetical protein
VFLGLTPFHAVPEEQKKEKKKKNVLSSIEKKIKNAQDAILPSPKPPLSKHQSIAPGEEKFFMYACFLFCPVRDNNNNQTGKVFNQTP